MSNQNPGEQSSTQPRLIRLHDKDNVAATTVGVDAGQMLELEGRQIRAADAVATGHKMAIAEIAAGEKVVKYGVPIGSATCRIKPGQYVHTHNLKSDYLPTYTLDGSNPYLHGKGGSTQ
ncbi:MAG: UxaA family hydrolase [Planctomycetota bacterium]|nr:UxaA family hydrolase [Planctomycetota bacterium]